MKLIRYPLSLMFSNGQLVCWFLLIGLAVRSNPVNATIRYVNGAAASGGDGLAWGSAYQNLQDAINASVSGDEVWVAAGTYVPTQDPFGSTSPSDARNKTFYLKDGVKIYGGFLGSEDLRSQRNWAGNVTTLSGDLGSGSKCYHVVLSVADGNTTELDGFTVTNGNASGGSAITVETLSISQRAGGGMYNVTSAIKITNCIFSGNAGGNGSGVANRSGAPITMTNCIVRDNNSTAHGGGIYNAVGSSGTFMNCTVYGNTAGNIGGAGMYNESGNSPTLRNCIVYGNTYGGNPSAIIDDNSLSNIAYSLIQGGSSGGGNINADPLFVSTGNLRLQFSSPARNAGTSTGAPTTDLDGNPRPSGCLVDMGAYEYQQAEPEINLQGGTPYTDITDGSTSTSTVNATDFGTVSVSSPLVKTYKIQNTGTADLTITSFDKTGTHSNDFTVGGITLPVVITAGNEATFTITFTPGSGGTRTATIKANNDDCNEAVYDFAVTGRGALNYTFNGTTNTDWATAVNWSTGVVPTSALLVSGDAVVIAANCVMNDVTISFPAGTSLTVNTGIALSPNLNTYITIASGATLTLNASASMSQGRITNNGTIDIYGSYAAFYMTNNSGGVMNVKSGGSYSCAACAQAFNSGGIVNNDGTLNFGTGSNAGTINNNAGGVISDVAGGAQLTNSGTINNAGTFTSRSSSTTGPFNNTGTFNMPTSCLFTVNGGGSFSNTGGFTVPSGSSFNINASGTLTNNSAGAITNNGTFTVNASGTLTNNGTYKGSGTYNTSLFTNPSGATVAPGNSPGCLTFSNGYTNSGTLSIELGGTTACTQYDRLNVTGTATLGGTLDVSLINSYTGANGHQLTIISATALSGTFATVNLPANWYINYDLPSVGQVTLSYNAALVAGTALHFDGVNDNVSIPNTAALQLDQFTLETWFNPSTAANFPPSPAALIAKGAAGTPDYFMVPMFNARKILAGFWAGATAVTVLSTTDLAQNTWYHLAVTFDGTTLKMYVNGVLENTVSAAGLHPQVTTNALSLGLTNGNQYVNGAMDEVRIWNTARTCDQISRLRNCELTGSEANLVAYYKFNQGAAEGTNTGVTTLTDATANGNNGTLNGFALSGSTSNWVTPGGVTTGTSCPAVTAPEIDLQGGTPLVSIPDGDTSPAAADGTDFGNVLVNGSLKRTFTILNTGNSVLSTAITISPNNGSFSISNLPSSVAANSSADFDVTFNPTATGAQTATITVTNNDCDEGVYDFVITGNGGVPGAALDLSSSNDYVALSGTTTLLDGAAKFTIEHWIKSDGTGSVGIVGKGASGCCTNTIHTGLDVNGVFFLKVGNQDGGITGTGVVPTGTWVHLAAVYDGTATNPVDRIKIYRNGVLQTTSMFGSIPATAPSANVPFTIGSALSDGSLNYRGQIDEVRIWNTALTCNQISQRYACELVGNESNLAAYYKFNQGIAEVDNSAITSLTDAASNGYHGTFGNMPRTGSTSNFVAVGGVTTGTSCTAVVAAEIDVQGGTPYVSITDGDPSPSTTDGTDFGSVLVNGSLKRTFTILNTGNSVLSTAVTISPNNGSFSISNLPTSVAAGSSADFDVTFNPTATGAQTATITVTNNDCDEGVYDFAVTGNGALPGAALSFDGVDDYVVTSTSPVLTGGGFTVELWAKRSGSGTYDIAVGQGSGGGGAGNVLHVGFRDSNQFTFAFFGDDLDVNAGYSDNNWHHWACVYTGAPAGSNNQFVYRDGVLVGSRTTTGAYGGSGPITIGTVYYALTADAFSGTMDEVRIWNTARTCDQINQLRNCELAGNEANLVAYYKFNQGIAGGDNTAVTSLTDAGPNGYNGTFNNMPRTGSTSNFVAVGGVTTGTSCTAVVAPEINVKGNTQDIIDGANSPSTSDHTDFNGSITRTFTIQNTGNAVLTVSSITSSNTKFAISGAPASVAAGSSATFTVTYNPTDVTAQTSTITINTDDCDEAAYDFAVTATATAAKALHFDGVDDEVIANSTSTFFGTTPTTIEFWAKVNSGEGGVFIMDLGFKYQIGFNGTFGLSGFFLGAYNSGATVLADGNWAHYAVTYDGVNTFKAYKNGLPTPTPSCTDCFSSFPAVTNAQLRVGIANNGYHFKGAIDEVRVWREERTAAQILANYNTEIASMSPCLDIYLKFNHGFIGANNSAFTTATDAANAVAANGTLNSFALTGATSNWVAGSGITEVTSAYIPAPEANLKGIDNSTITDGTSTTSTTVGTGFGTVPAGNTLTRTFTFENTGNADLTVSNITSSNSLFTASSVATTPITGGTSTTFTVTFAPTTSGVQNAVITVINDDCDEANYNFSVTGTGSCTAPAFTACPGNQTAGTAGSCSATVNYTATASGIPASAVTYVFSGATVESGSGTGSGSVFNKGVTTVTLTAANGCGSNATCSFTVTVNDTEAPVLTCSSNQTLTTPSGICTADYTLADPISDNCSGATWGYTLSGATTGSGSTIADGSGSGVIHFNIGTTTVTLTGTDGTNSATGCSFTVTVNAPEINVTGNTISIEDGDTSPSASDYTDFGEVSNNGSLVRTFQIQNTGTAALIITEITVNNAKFTVGSLSPAGPIPANGSANFTVTFSPTATGTQNAVITISNNDCDEAVYDFAVTGSSPAPTPNALHFDGADDLIEIPGNNTTLFGSQATTVEFWAKGAPGFAFPINFDGANMSVVWGPALAMSVYGDNNYFTNYPIEDCWHHYAFTYNGIAGGAGTTGTIYAFVDGQPTPTPSFTGNFPAVSTNLWLGSRVGNYPWNGTLDELRIWNVQRTQAQLQANMFNELAGNEPGLVSYYNFNQGSTGGNNASVTTLFDVQTNSERKNGSLYSFALNGNTSNWVATGALIKYPEIDIQGNLVSIVDGDATPSEDDHTSFGDIVIGNNLIRTYTIKNTGAEVLNISNITSNNSLFKIGGFTNPFQIPVNGSATFTVTFAPETLGPQTATITVNNDDCNEAVYDFAVSGTSTCAATAGITGTNSPVCVGNNAVFTLSGSVGGVVTYKINEGANATTTLTGGTATVTVSNAAADQTLTLISVNDGTCTLNLTGTAKVTVKPLPVVSTPASAVCVGGTITLSPTTGGTWVSSAPAKATVTDAGLVTGVASGSVTFTFTETVSGCSNTTAAVTVNVLPTAVVSGGGTVCADEPLPNVTIALTGTAPWSLTYEKSGTATSVTDIANSPYTITGAAAGTYTVTSLSDAHCTGTSMTGSAEVIVNPLPVLTAGAVTHPTTCAGTNGSITFTTANLPDGNYTLTYTGAGSPKTVTVAANAFTLTGLSAGAYSQFSITRVACTGTDNSVKTLADPNPPTAGIAGTVEVCQNAAEPGIMLTGATGTAPYTFIYRINNGPELTATTVSGNAVTLTQTTGIANTFTYSLVSVRDANGCSQPQNGSAVITVNALPVLTFTGANPVCQGQTSALSSSLAGTWIANAPSVATIGSDGTITALQAGTATFTFTASGTGCSAASGSLTVKPTPTSALTASKTDVCPNTSVTLDARCSIPTAAVNWSPGGPTIIPAAATLPYVYKASCTADGCTGNETSVEIRTHRILVDMKDLGAGLLPKTAIGSVIANMAPVNQVTAPADSRRWTFIATGCEPSESAVFKLSGPVSFNTIDNAAPFAMFANEGSNFYSIDHPNYGTGGSFPNGTYTLTVDLRAADGVGGPFPKNRVARGGLLATRTLQFTVGGTGAIRQGAVGQEGKGLLSDNGQRITDNGVFALIAPNPVSHTLQLKVNEVKGQQVDVHLTDVSGRVLLQRGFVPEANVHSEEFDVSEISDGMYLLKVKAGEKQTTLKVIKFK
ncbi:MAG: choice-of-anchor D domain-containing protein [Spirosomataceae bacterium]